MLPETFGPKMPPDYSCKSKPLCGTGRAPRVRWPNGSTTCVMPSEGHWNIQAEAASRLGLIQASAPMASGQLSNYWRQAGDTLGFAVESPHEVFLSSGHRLTFPVRLPDFGAEHGMLLTDNYADFAAHADALGAAGYRYSVLSVPNDAPRAAALIERPERLGLVGLQRSPRVATGALTLHSSRSRFAARHSSGMRT